ncbi:hypothetical protein [Vibrio atypicus]|uniref:hypothetical protein n=1 Tax=Vibrio atypicus TaxID=558271 RepID=UPI001358A652|nr:hypothetical protein [Vibrio atypicus]
MLEKVIFHIGLHKTGTTSLQFDFLRNSRRLKKSGISYPKFYARRNALSNHSWPILNLILSSPSDYHLNISNKMTNNERDDFFKATLKTLHSQAKDSPVMLISGEGLSIVGYDALVRLRNHFQLLSIKPIEFEFHYFTRSKFSFIQSIIQERVKNGESEHAIVNSMASNMPSNEYIHIDELKRVFNKSKLYKHDYDLACNYEGGIKSYFFSNVLGMDSSLLRLNEKYSKNKSLSVQSYEMIKFYTENSVSNTGVPVLGSEYKSNIDLLSRFSGRRFQINERHKELILDVAAKKNTAVREAWEKFFLERNNIFSLQEVWQGVDVKKLTKIINLTSEECKNILVDYFVAQALFYKSLNDINTANNLINVVKKITLDGELNNSRLASYFCCDEV